MIIAKCDDCNQDYYELEVVEAVVNIGDMRNYISICEDCLDKRIERGDDIYVDD